MKSQECVSAPILSSRVPGSSLPLKLAVGVIDANDPRMPRPAIAEADASFIVDLSSFDGDATILIEAWPLMASGQRYWLDALAGGERHVVAADELVEEAGDLTRPLARDWLDALVHPAYVTLELTIQFGDDADESATVIRSRSHEITYGGVEGWGSRAIYVDTLATYRAISPKPIVANGETVWLPLCSLHPVGANIVEDDKNLPSLEGGASEGLAHLRFGHGCVGVSLSLTLDRAGASTITAFDETGAEAKRVEFSGAYDASFEANGGGRITALQFTSPAGAGVRFQNLRIQTGRANGFKDTPYVETFDETRHGTYQDRYEDAMWIVSSWDAEITLEAAGVRFWTHSPSIKLRVTPKFCIQPRVGIHVRLSFDKLPSLHVVYASATPANGDPTLRRVLFKPQLPGVLSLTDPGDLAQPDEYISHFEAALSLPTGTNYFVIRSIEFD